MRKLAILLSMVAVMVLTVATPSFAHTWTDFDVSNSGRTATVWEHTRFDGAWDQVRAQLNDMAGTRGVIYQETGTSSSWEVNLKDGSLPSGIGGTTINRVWCDPTCVSSSTVTISTAAVNWSYRVKLMIFRHEFGHTLGAPHEPCNMAAVSIMLGAPLCYQAPSLINYGSHDKDNYTYNRQRGVYDEGPVLATVAPLYSTEDANVRSVVAGMDEADTVKVIHKRGGTLIVAKYHPHTRTFYKKLVRIHWG